MPLSEVSEIREGWLSDKFRKVGSKTRKRSWQKPLIGTIKSTPFKDERCFSLVTYNKRSLDLVAVDKLTKDRWVQGLRYVVMELNYKDRLDQKQAFIKQSFENADSNQDGYLDFGEICELLKKMNISINKEAARTLFEVTFYCLSNYQLNTF